MFEPIEDPTTREEMQNTITPQEQQIRYFRQYGKISMSAFIGAGVVLLEYGMGSPVVFLTGFGLASGVVYLDERHAATVLSREESDSVE